MSNKIAWNKGKTVKTDSRIARPWLGKKRLNMMNEKHHMWKGDKAKYSALHKWIVNKFGNAKKCENELCFYPRKNTKGIILIKPSRYEWANISGKYKRERKDWKQMCPSCHRKMDLGVL